MLGGCKDIVAPSPKDPSWPLSRSFLLFYSCWFLFIIFAPKLQRIQRGIEGIVGESQENGRGWWAMVDGFSNDGCGGKCRGCRDRRVAPPSCGARGKGQPNRCHVLVKWFRRLAICHWFFAHKSDPLIAVRDIWRRSNWVHMAKIVINFPSVNWNLDWNNIL